MASVSINIGTTTVVKSVTLELTLEEAHAVKHLVGSIRGHGEFRDITDDVYHALSSSGIGNAIYDTNGAMTSFNSNDIVMPKKLTIQGVTNG